MAAFSCANQQARLLVSGPWHDRDPAVSPDGSRIAFSSHRDGNWELYLLDVEHGSLRRLTNTDGLERNPAWSPDGLWITYEAYYESNFDIWIMPVDARQAPIQLTSDLADDTSPAWDPINRRIAFVSDRDGNPDIFFAHLDRADERFVNLTQSSQSEMDPAFSPGGSALAYVTQQADMDFIRVKDPANLGSSDRVLGQGRSPTWTSDGSTLLAILHAANDSYLMLYPLEGNGSSVAGLPQPDRLMDIGWSSRDVIGDLTSAGILLEAPDQDVGSHGASDAAANGSIPLVALPGVSAPIPKLSESVVTAFSELRDRVVLETGWDFLGTLDNAFVGVNDPMPPGYANVDWLYTGRAFSFNSAALHARWVEIVREDFGGLTYWRVFVLVSRQDGSLGEPMRSLPWDLEARFNNHPADYDGGGKERSEIPSGYYVDFTELAADYGFERQPALQNWRTFFPGARFNEYVRTEGLTWDEAMLEIYPPSAFVTPTPYRTPIPSR
jgi:TolB protein